MNTYSTGKIDALFAALPPGFTRVGNIVLHPNLLKGTIRLVLPSYGDDTYSLNVHVMYYQIPFGILLEHNKTPEDWEKSEVCASCKAPINRKASHHCKHYFPETVLVGVSENIFKRIFAWLISYTRDSSRDALYYADSIIYLPQYWRSIMHPALAHIEAIHSDLYDPLCKVLNVFPVHGFKFRFDGVPNGVKIELVATYAGISITVIIIDLLLPTYEVTVIIRGAVLSITPDVVHCGNCKRGNTEMCAHTVKTIRCEYHSENPGQTEKIGAAVGILVRDIQALAQPVPVPKERILKPLPDGGCLTYGDCGECSQRYLSGLSESKMPLE